MDVREWLNRHQRVVTLGTVLVVLVAIGTIVYQLRPEKPSTMQWYSSDDGQTWFKDSDQLIPPFDRDRKQTVVAHVRECDGKPFVLYMERYRPEGKKIWDAYRADEAAGKPDLREGRLIGIQNHLEFKKPGDKDWAPASDGRKVLAMTQAKCPDGVDDPIVVWP